MKRYFLLVVLCAAIGRGEEVKLPKNVIMHFGKNLVTLKAGTVVQVVKRDPKAITVKADGNLGTIPLDSFAPAAPEATKPASPPAVANASANVVPSPAAKPAQAAPSGGAVTNYGKAVEKARAVTDQHEKAMVSPEDGLLDKR